jgi:hypothetical protein
VAVAAPRKEEGELRREHRTLTRAEWATITTLRPVVRRYPKPGRQPPGDRGERTSFRYVLRSTPLPDLVTDGREWP